MKSNNNSGTIGRLDHGHMQMIRPCLLVALLILFIACCMPQTTKISGRVVSAEDNSPIEGALVYISSALPSDETEHNVYTTTDSDGRFIGTARGELQMRVWKPGYALRTAPLGQDWDSKQAVVIKLSALRGVDFVLETHALYDLSPARGFSFSLGKAVDGTVPDADFVFKKDEHDEGITYIVASGSGGIVFQPADELIDFGNSPEAPLSGYETRLRYPAAQGGFYFVRTGDGRHYAKFFSPLLWTRSDGEERRLDIANTELIWAYQPNGTRNLENSPRTLPFPFGKFGLKRESLTR